MTTFPNFGLINQMSKHLANNTSPRILDYNVSNYNGYTYTPSSTDLVNQPLSTNNSITQQQRFNAMAEQLMLSGVGNSGGGSGEDINNNVEHRIIRQGNLIDNLIMPQQNINPQTQMLNTTAPQGRINDNKEGFIFHDEMMTKEAARNRNNIIGTVIIVFIVFMLVQLYLSQKKLEIMMNVYKPQPMNGGMYPNVLRQQQQNGMNFQQNEVF